MTSYEFKLPDVGEGTLEAEIVAWHVAVGDQVAEDQLLAEVMTDKATVELTSPVAGRVTALNGVPGSQAAVGAPLVVFALAGDQAPVAPVAATPAAVALPVTTPAPLPSAGAALAAPAVRRRASRLGLDLSRISGSGPDGRVLHEDLDDLLRQGEAAAPAVVATDEVEDIPVIGLRRRIAERMAEASRQIAHFSYVEEIDLTALEALRRDLNQRHAGQRGRLTLLPFLLRAMVAALAEYPQMNARFDDEAMVIHRFAAAHVGIATQTDLGLMVPVLRHAEGLDLWQSAAAITRLANAARDGSIQARDLSGSTITLTSLGALGGIVSTPVINRPEVAIVGVNKLVERPMVRDSQVVVRSMMNLSSSFDHRVIDGADAAGFIQAIRLRLEQPATLFIV